MKFVIDYLVLSSGTGAGSRRIAAEGEEVHVATVYFEILPEAIEVARARVRVGAPADSIIIVRHGNVDLRGTIEPLDAAEGAICILGSDRGLLGDSNGDGSLDISDPVWTLGFLFLGFPPPVCLGAADFNRDSKLDLSDPVASLGYLFLGDPFSTGSNDGEIPCR